MEDLTLTLWLFGAYSQEYNDFLVSRASCAEDGEIYTDSPNKKIYLKKFVDAERADFHKRILTQTLEQKVENMDPDLREKLPMKTCSLCK